MAKRNKYAQAWELFNRDFWEGYNGDGDGDVHILWFDKVGCFNLLSNIVVEIELVTHGTADHYKGYEVRLNHKQNGPITGKKFLFNDYLDEREDDRQNDYPTGSGGTFYVSHSEHKGVNWYIAIPTFDDIAHMQSAIMSFISHYGTPSRR